MSTDSFLSPSSLISALLQLSASHQSCVLILAHLREWKRSQLIKCGGRLTKSAPHNHNNDYGKQAQIRPTSPGLQESNTTWGEERGRAGWWANLIPLYFTDLLITLKWNSTDGALCLHWDFALKQSSSVLVHDYTANDGLLVGLRLVSFTINLDAGKYLMKLWADILMSLQSVDFCDF